MGRRGPMADETLGPGRGTMTVFVAGVFLDLGLGVVLFLVGMFLLGKQVIVDLEMRMKKDLRAEHAGTETCLEMGEPDVRYIEP